jgi:glycosyltransferase involved in cell wall biosynthesis
VTTDSLVSVIVPAYNADAFIDEALHSVLAQSYKRIETIVVDDGSTDSTPRRVAAFGNRVTYVRRANSGGYPGVPRNTGITRASGEFICFLDADDVMRPDRLEQQVDFLRRHPDAGCVFGDYQNFSDAGPEGPPHFSTCRRLSARLRDAAELALAPEEATALLLRENFGIPSSLAINRRALAHVAGFPTHIRIGEDLEFAYLIARRLPVGVINRVLVMRRFHGTNVSSDTLRTLHDQVVSFTSLRETERIPGNCEQLDERLYRCELGLARIYSNQRQYGRALAHSARALRDAVRPRRPGRVREVLRSVLRTAAIALRLKAPAP